LSLAGFTKDVIDEIETLYILARETPSFRPNEEAEKFLEALSKGQLVESVNLSKIHEWNNMTYFHIMRSKFGYVTPTLKWSRELKKIIGKDTVLEVGAGTGLVAKYLNEVGIKIIPTDDFSWHYFEGCNWKPFFDVKKLDFRDAIRKYRADYLLLCWPPYSDPMAKEAAELFTKLNPSGSIIYIGEYDGCTGDEDFRRGIIILDYLEKVNNLYPRWDGLHDYVYLVKWVGNADST
jgi:hypothetical protein